jgi:hypothetical protein
VLFFEPVLSDPSPDWRAQVAALATCSGSSLPHGIVVRGSGRNGRQAGCKAKPSSVDGKNRVAAHPADLHSKTYAPS